MECNRITQAESDLGRSSDPTFVGKKVQILAEYWQGIHTYIILSKGRICMQKTWSSIKPMLFCGVFLLLRNFILPSKPQDLPLTELLGTRGNVLICCMCVGYVRALGICDGFYVET